MAKETGDFYREIKALAEEMESLRERSAQADRLCAVLDRMEKDLAAVWLEMDYYYEWADRLANTPVKSFPMAAAEFQHLHRVRTVSGPEGLKLQQFMRIRHLLEEKGLIKPIP